MITCVVNRAWPGVKNGQLVKLHPIRAKCLLDAGMVSLFEPAIEIPKKRGRPRKTENGNG
jgi:hypothetical protein